MRKPVLVSMSGPGDFDVSQLSDLEAGIAFLALVNKEYPGVTFRELEGLGYTRMGWSLVSPFKSVGSAIADGFGNVKDGIGDVLRDTFSMVGSAGGDTIRLFTDQKVIDGASQIGMAYATSGGSEGVKQVLGSDTGGKVLDFFSALGNNFKNTSAAGLNTASAGGVLGLSPNVAPWVLGGLAVVTVIALMNGRGGNS